MKNKASRQIIVLGMHRSGTSLTINLLSAMGCYVGKEKDLLPASDANPQGFWEHMAVVDINKAILNSIGLDWISADQFDLKKIPPTTKKNLSAQIKEIVKNFNRHEVWAIKDPRLCMILPLWKKHLPNALIFVCVRHPMEIAKSLEKRNGLPLSVGCAIWESYTRALIENCKGMECLVVSYSELIDTPQTETKRIVTWLQNHDVPGISPISAQMLQKISNPRLYRQHFNEKKSTNILTEDQQTLFAEFRKRTVPLPNKIQEGSRLSQDLLELFNINRKLSKNLKEAFRDPEGGMDASAASTPDKEMSFFQLEKMVKKQKAHILRLKESTKKINGIKLRLAEKVQEKNGRITQLKEILNGNEFIIKQQVEQLQKQKIEVDELNQKANIAQASAKQQLKQTQDQSLKIAELEKTAKEKELILEKRSAETQEYLARIEHLGKAAAENKAILAKQIKQIQEQKASHEKLKEIANDRKTTIRNLDKANHDQAHQISQLETIIKKNEETISHQIGTINELKKHVEDVQKLASSLEAEGKKALGVFMVGGKSFNKLQNKIFNSVLPVHNKMD
jgi:hypothetical protein